MPVSAGIGSAGITACARRSSSGCVFGQGFNSPRLHQKKIPEPQGFRDFSACRKSPAGFSDKGERAGNFSEFCEIQRNFPAVTLRARPGGPYTCVTKGIFSDAHVAGKNIELEFFDKLENPEATRVSGFFLCFQGILRFVLN